MKRDSNHIAQIDALIPMAEMLAKKRVAMLKQKVTSEIGVNGEPYAHYMETQYFHEEMDRMKREAGLIA